MKKSISVLLTGAFVMTMTTGAFAGPVEAPTSLPKIPAVVAPIAPPQLQIFQGQIVKITEDKGVTSLEVKANDKDETMIFHLSDKTYVIDTKTGFSMKLDARTGDGVTVYYGPATTMSLPAQSTATAVMVNSDDKIGGLNYAKVEAITKNAAGDVVVTTDGGSRLVTLGKDMPITPFMTKNIVTVADVKVGSELLLSYDIMAMSMPAQANALKAVILSTPVAAETPAVPEEAVVDTVIISTEAGVISVNEAEVDFPTGPVLYTNANGDMMVPVRVIAEQLGYKVLWTEGNDTITLQRDAKSATFTLGDMNYGANKMRVQLKSAPELRDGVTYVPAEFFTQALGVTVTVNNDHV